MFQSFACNVCHDILLMSFGINNIATLNMVLVIIISSLELAKMKP